MKFWKKTDFWLAWGLFIGTLVLVRANTTDLGITRDEGYYFDAAESYAGWFRTLWQKPAEAFSEPIVRRHFEINHEHPPLVKNLMALSYLEFSPQPVRGWPPERRGDYLRAMRLPAALFSALAVVLVFLLGRELASRRVGLLAALGFLLAPRHFYHARLACLDMPACALWLAVVWAWRRSWSSFGWAIGCSLLWGLSISAKHNGWFLPPMLFLHWLLVRGGEFGLKKEGLRLPPLPWALVFMPLAGGMVLFALWPWLWHDTWARLKEYFSFHLNHINYPWEYFGRLVVDPPYPWLYPFVVTAVTLPLALLVPATAGFFLTTWERLRGPFVRLFFRLRRKTFTGSPEEKWFSSADGWLVLLGAFFPIFIIALPSVPIFGGMKHWICAMPFLCLLGARALELSAGAFSAKWQKPAFWTAGALMLLSCLLGNWRIGNYGTSYYNELLGGVRGAADWGFQRQYWSNNVTGVLDWLNKNAPSGARLFLHEVNGESFRTYQRDGYLRPDVRAGWWFDQADITAYQYHREFVDVEYQLWNKLGHRKPVYGLYLDEVPIITVYDHRQR